MIIFIVLNIAQFECQGNIQQVSHTMSKGEERKKLHTVHFDLENTEYDNHGEDSGVGGVCVCVCVCGCV